MLVLEERYFRISFRSSHHHLFRWTPLHRRIQLRCRRWWSLRHTICLRYDPCFYSVADTISVMHAKAKNLSLQNYRIINVKEINKKQPMIDQRQKEKKKQILPEIIDFDPSSENIIGLVFQKVGINVYKTCGPSFSKHNTNNFRLKNKKKKGKISNC